MFHTFGDSHCKFGFEQIDNIQIHWLPGKLCYSFGKNKLNLLDIRSSNYNVNEGDFVLFSFGEIDCRAQIYKYVNDEHPYEKIIDELVENYFEAIKENIKFFKNITTIVYNIVPPTDILLFLSQEQANKYVYIKEKYDNIPWKGTNDDRKKYHLYFNIKLKEKCLENGYIFFDIYNKYCDENGFLLRNYSDGNVHIQNPIFLKEFIQQIIL
jgi:hypothetical protein